MSELEKVLDEMVESLMATMTKEQITRLMVGYFAAVEAWEVAQHEPAGLKDYHAHTRKILSGAK